MPGGFPILGPMASGVSLGAAMIAYSGPPGTEIGTSNTGGANTKGPWVLVTASCPIDCAYLNLMISGQTAATADSTGLVDIGIGASGSQVVLIPNIIVDWQNSAYIGSFGMAMFPAQIKKGTPIYIRTQSSGGVSSNAYQFTYTLQMFDSAFGAEGFQGVDDLGTVLSGSCGTAITIGATAKGAYSQLIAATARDYSGVMIGYSVVSTNFGNGCFDLAIGASGSEVIIVPDWTTFNRTNKYSIFYPVHIPKGSRIAIRAGSNYSVATIPATAMAWGFYQ